MTNVDKDILIDIFLESEECERMCNEFNSILKEAFLQGYSARIKKGGQTNILV